MPNLQIKHGHFGELAYVKRNILLVLGVDVGQQNLASGERPELAATLDGHIPCADSVAMPATPIKTPANPANINLNFVSMYTSHYLNVTCHSLSARWSGCWVAKRRSSASGESSSFKCSLN
jgi:hypothetical protein